MLRKSFNATAAAVAIALSLSACGGGGTSALPSTGAPTTGSPTQDKTAQASMTIKIPAKAVSSSSKAQYISASTQSMTIGIVSGSKTTQLAEVDLTPASKSCAALAGGGLQCNVTFVGQAGKNIFALSMYDKTGGSGNVLSTGNVPATLTAGQNTNIAITLDGVPASVAAVLGAGTLQVGTASSTSVIVVAKDSDGNIIVGPGGYSTPITLAIKGDTYGTLSLSKSAVASSGDAVTLSYNGGTNVGSTIAPSIGTKPGTAANFAGEGGAITYIAPTLNGGGSSLYPYSITALPNGSAAFLIGRSYSCCPPQFYGAIGTTTSSGTQAYFVGDTSDPFNPGTATSPFTSGVTVVPGMSVTLNMDSITGCCSTIQQHQLTSDANGNVYYGTNFTSTAANNGCAGGGGTLVSGTIGKFNPNNHTTVEKVLKGKPLVLQTDSSGNVWFIEQSGTCNGSSLLSSGYGIGELSSTGALTETDFATAGISATTVTSMSITPNGSQMFIGDNSAATITKISTSSLSGATSISLAGTNASSPLSLATAPDGTTLWFSNTSSGDSYYYGYIPGSSAFSAANISQGLYPVSYSEQYDTVYADGSFWGGNEEGGGFQRIAGVASGTPQYQFYGPSAYYNEPSGVAADTTHGYIWGADWDYGSIMLLQYGGLSNATTTMARKVGNLNTTRANTALHKH